MHRTHYEVTAKLLFGNMLPFGHSLCSLASQTQSQPQSIRRSAEDPLIDSCSERFKSPTRRIYTPHVSHIFTYYPFAHHSNCHPKKLQAPIKMSQKLRFWLLSLFYFMNSFERTVGLRSVRLAEQIAYYHTHKRKCKCVCPVDAA